MRADELKILRAAIAGTLPRTIKQDSSEFSYDALRKLCDTGMMTAGEVVPVSGPRGSTNPRITWRGKEYLAELEQLAVPDHAGEPAADPANSHKDWHERLVGKIGVGVTIAVLGFIAVYLITHFLRLAA